MRVESDEAAALFLSGLIGLALIVFAATIVGGVAIGLVEFVRHVTS